MPVGCGAKARVVVTDRLSGVDAARGLALLGMTAVHVLPLTGDDGATSPAHLLAAGRSAALFAVLAGVGIALASGGRRPLRGQQRARFSAALVLRALVVGLIGLLLAELGSGIAVILAYYAVLFVLAVPLLGLGPRRLAAVAVTVALLMPALSYLLRSDLPRAPGASPGIDMLLADPGGLLQVLLLTGYYPALSWVAYLCAGLAVGRLALGSRWTAAWLLVAGVGLAVAAVVTSALLLVSFGGYAAIEAASDASPADVDRGRFGTVPTDTWWWLATDAPHSTTPPDLLHTVGTALAAVGLLLLLAGPARLLLAPLAAAGSMPLTLYTLHLIVLGLVDDADPLPFWLLQVGAALAGALLWRAVVGRGPLEALLARLTHAVTGRSRNSGPPVCTPAAPPPA